MKKLVFALLISAVLFVSCSSKKTDFTIIVGATPVPHAEILALVKNDLAKKGFTLKIIEFTDYTTPNTALLLGELDANFFQHIQHLESKEVWEAKLVDVLGVHIEPFGLYSKKIKNIADLQNGATIAIPNDPSNMGRALLLMAANGLIMFKPEGRALASAGLATINDIAANPKRFKFRELEATQLTLALINVDAAAINGNYVFAANLTPKKDALIIEGADSPYVNVVAVRRGTENDAKIKALVDVLHSQKVKDFITNKWADGSVVPAF